MKKKVDLTPSLDVTYRELKRRPRQGFTTAELGERTGMSQAAANMNLIRLRDHKLAKVVGKTHDVGENGKRTRAANIWVAAA